MIDLVRDARTRRVLALKRIACHSAQDESAALQEAAYMRAVRHRNLAPCTAYAVNERPRHRTALSEVLIAMPYYKVCGGVAEAGGGVWERARWGQEG